MTKEQIKARVCELFEFGGDKWFDYEAEFMTLAAEIAAAERKACAKVCDSWPLSVANMERMAAWKGNQSNAVAGAIYECGSLIRKRPNVEVSRGAEATDRSAARDTSARP